MLQGTSNSSSENKGQKENEEIKSQVDNSKEESISIK